MGKNKLKKLKEATRYNDFKSFSNDFKREKNHPVAEPKTEYKPEYKNSNPRPKPESQTNVFLEMVDRVKESFDTTYDTQVRMRIIKNKKKEATGIVFVKVEFSLDNWKTVEANSSLFIFYMENKVLNKNLKLNNYLGHIQVIVQKTGNVLFSRFGCDCIEKSEEYIKDIFNKNFSFLSGTHSKEKEEAQPVRPDPEQTKPDQDEDNIIEYAEPVE